ncbi:MAG: glycosyltransferase [Anaerolineales bacterium]|nr:glycosyltransferase [Anaerolineales bacterium]
MGTEVPSAQPVLTIMMPAYGEAENLRLLLPSINKIIDSLSISAEVLVLAAASPLDDTQKVCIENQVRFCPRQGGNRYGDAIRTGIAMCKGDFVITMDSDGSHNPQFIHELWKRRMDADVVIASRYIHGGVTENPWALVAMSRVLNIVFKVFVGIPVYDVSNSFRLYRGALLRTIQPVYPNFDVLEEILARIIWGKSSHPATILEIPFHFEQRKYGKPKRQLIIFGLQFVSALFKLRLLRSKYRA